MAGSTDISRFYAQLARQRRTYASTSEHRKVAPGIKLDTLGKKMINKELTTSAGFAHTKSGGLSDSAKRRVRLAARRQLAKKAGLSDSERKHELHLYMQDVEKLWGQEGTFTKKARDQMKKTGPVAAPSREERVARGQSAAVSAGRSVARDLRTGTDREGNRVSYASDRGSSSFSPSSAPSPSSSSSPSRGDVSSHSRFSPPSGGQ